MHKKIFISLGILVLLFTAANADTFKLGQSIATFLKISPDPMGSGMGDANLVTFVNPTAVFYNPGNIAWIKKKSITAGQTQYFLDMKLSYAAAIIPTDFAVFGLKFKNFNYGDIYRTTEDNITPGSETIDLGDNYFGLTVGKQVTDRLGIGVGINYLQETLDDTDVNAIMFDIGSFYYVGWNSLRFGMALTNYGPAVKVLEESYHLPLTYKLGAAYDFTFSEDMMLTTALDIHDVNDSKTQFNIGANFSLFNLVHLRAGYKINYDQEDFSFGVGAGKDLGSFNIGVDYAFQNMKDFDAVQKFGIRFGF